MAVETPIQSAYGTQTGTTYTTALDKQNKVSKALVDQFVVHEQATPNLTVHMEAGTIYKADRTLVSVAAQDSATLVAPSVNPRKDIVYYDAETGALGVAKGAEASSPIDPAIPPRKIPCARINWTVGMAAITNAVMDYLGARAPSAEIVLQAANQFAVHEQASPNLTVRMEAGIIFKPDRTFSAIAAQSSSALSAPSTNPRKDIVYYDATSGAIGVATGTEAGSPVDPAIPANKIPRRRINWIVGMTTITNDKLDDLTPSPPSLDALLQAANTWLARQTFKGVTNDPTILRGISNTQTLPSFAVRARPDFVAQILGGCDFDGTNFVASSTEACVVSINSSGQLAVAQSTGLTAGNTFSPSTTILWDATGKMTAGSVPLARMGSVVVNSALTLAANTRGTFTLASADNTVARFFKIDVRQTNFGTSGGNTFNTPFFDENDTLTAGQPHWFMSRGHTGIGSQSDFVWMVNPTGSSREYTCKAYQLVES